VYRSEGHKMFGDLQAGIQYEVVHTVFHAELNQQQPPNGSRSRPGTTQTSPMKAVNDAQRGSNPMGGKEKVGRNAPCPCGSGKKYKRCHGST